MLPYEIQYDWAEYKKDTEYVAGFLLQKSTKCGYRRHVKIENLKGHIIHHSEFASMAQWLADNATIIKLPRELGTILARAIRYRREVTSWYRTTTHGSMKDDQHDAFTDCLQEALKILQPCMQRKMAPERMNNRAEPSKSTPIDNLFDKLKLHDTCDNDQYIVADLRKMPSVPKVEINIHKSNLEDEFWLEIKAFLKELDNLRNYLLRMWLQDETDLITKALVTNTAICIVRRKETELDNSLVRPVEYPATKYPTWCLPALLLYRDAAVEPLLQMHDMSVEMIVLPSPHALNTRALSEQGQEHARLCCYNVYNGLKFLSYALKQHPANRGPGLLIIYEAFSKLQAVHPEVLEAFQWAQAMSVEGSLSCSASVCELTRGIQNLRETDEIAIWITFGMQLHLDLQWALGDSISDALDEARKELIRLSIQDEQILKSIQPISAAYKNFHVESIKKPLDFLKTLLFKDDALVKRMKEFVTVEHEDILEAEMGRFVTQEHFFWKHSPIKCGLIKYNLTKMLRKVPLRIEYQTGMILSVVHLYNICRNLFHKDPYWPDMECIKTESGRIHRSLWSLCMSSSSESPQLALTLWGLIDFIGQQDPERLFYGRPPRNFREASKRLSMVLGISSITGESRRYSRIDRTITDTCFIDDLDFDISAETTEEQNARVKKLLTIMCDPKEAAKRVELLNPPLIWSKSMKTLCGKWTLLPRDELQPVNTVHFLRCYMDLLKVRREFDTFRLLHNCSELVAAMMEEVQYNEEVVKVYEDDPTHCTKYLLVLYLLLNIAANEEEVSRPDTPRPRLSQFYRIYKILQDYYLRPEKCKPEKKKVWVGDVCIARLVNFVEEKRNCRWASPESFFDGRGFDMKLIPTSDADAGLYAAIRLYKNWEWKDGEKEESRMFHAIERHRNAKWGWQIENEKLDAKNDKNGDKKLDGDTEDNNQSHEKGEVKNQAQADEKQESKGKARKKKKKNKR